MRWNRLLRSVAGRAPWVGLTAKIRAFLFREVFLGGPYNLRGWDYREAGPQISNEPSGGNSYSYLARSTPSKWRIRCALLFYDGGFLRTGDFKFIPGDRLQGWHDNWGLGLRIMVMGMPLRLDLGFPISDPSDTGGSPSFIFPAEPVFKSAI